MLLTDDIWTAYDHNSIFERLNMPTASSLATDGLVKHNLAERLRQEIMSGSLQPGMRIVEGKWAAKFGVAQGSIREAINILAQAGFVSKASGRSARVIHLSEGDVAHIYRLRGAIEGLAARLATATQPNLKVLQATVDVMRESASAGNLDALLDCDSLFHLELFHFLPLCACAWLPADKRHRHGTRISKRINGSSICCAKAKAKSQSNM
jgi:DNA-binding GntR family transcriptional regulator